MYIAIQVITIVAAAESIPEPVGVLVADRTAPTTAIIMTGCINSTAVLVIAFVALIGGDRLTITAGRLASPHVALVVELRTVFRSTLANTSQAIVCNSAVIQVITAGGRRLEDLDAQTRSRLAHSISALVIKVRTVSLDPSAD
jgi:hypothetical protein